MLNIILGCDILLLDEIARSTVKTHGFNATNLKTALFKLVEKGLITTPKQLAAFGIFTEPLDRFIESDNFSFFANPTAPLDFFEARKYGLELITYLKDEDQADFQMLALALMENQFVRNGVIISPVKHTFKHAFTQELQDRGFKGKVIITGACLPETKDFINIKQFTMPDFNNTEKQQLIVVDKANWNFVRHWDREKGKVEKILGELISCFPGRKILVVAINMKIKNEIESWNLSLDVVEYTYYRNVDTLGVEMPHRIAVYVGLPFTPNNSYRENDLIYDEFPGTFRKLEISDALKNSFGRPKDPEGKERSIAFLLGGNHKNFKKYFSEKVEVVQTLIRGNLHEVAAPFAFLWLEHGAKYDDFKILPKVAEAINCPSKEWPLNIFAARNGLKSIEFKKLFNRYRYLFPPSWEIYQKGRGHYIKT